ncbi:MAG: S4 domain-containing protein, partial [Schleiferiaceae bacterium]
MRADVYLWAVRLFKTRALAAEALRDGRVSVGGTLLKASKELKVGEVFVLRERATSSILKCLACRAR